MAFRCSLRRNWVWLWKPTGDALAPVLGFTNLGKFIPGSVEEVITRDAPQEFYANPFLAKSDGQSEHD